MIINPKNTKYITKVCFYPFYSLCFLSEEWRYLSIYLMEDPTNSSTNKEIQTDVKSESMTNQQGSDLQRESHSEAIFVDKKTGYTGIKLKDVPKPVPGNI